MPVQLIQRRVGAGGTAASSFLPARRAGCICAYDPTNEPYEDGASVDILHDLSGLGNHATQVGSARPTFQKGIWRTTKPGVYFLNTSSQFLSIAGVASLLSGSDKPFTLGCVMRITHTTNQTMFSMGHSSTAAKQYMYDQASAWTAYRKADDAGTALRTGSASDSNDNYITYNFTGTAITMRVGGVAVINNQAMDVNTCAFDICRIGAQPTATGYMKGYLGAFVLYNRSLSATEITALETELLNWHYVAGITASGSVPGAAQVIPTYDGSNQPVHPDVIDAGVGNTVCGTKRYAMCMTPLPGGADTYENRSILVSDDAGVTDAWAAPVGLTNPVDPVLGGGLVEADPDLYYDSATTTAYLYWQSYYGAGNTRCVKVQTSTDLVTWGTPAVMFDAPSGEVSHSFLMVGTDMHCYYRNSVGEIMRRIGSGPLGPGWRDPERVNVPFYANQVPWHLNVTVDVAGKMWMLICAHVDARTWLYRSADNGLTWEGYNQAAITGSGAVFTKIYRSSIWPLGDDVTVSGLACLLGGYNNSNVYKIGYTTITAAGA